MLFARFVQTSVQAEVVVLLLLPGLLALLVEPPVELRVDRGGADSDGGRNPPRSSPKSSFAIGRARAQHAKAKLGQNFGIQTIFKIFNIIH